MIGSSSVFRTMMGLLDRIAQYDATVLIQGETGTGKELAARAIHYQGARRNKPFLPVNCGALQDALIENELFGHRRGAYTDARFDQAGLVEAASGGTLFLDEVDALSPKGQVTLLRFLEDREYRPIGAHSARSADVRIIAASNLSLDHQTHQGRFRADLLYRLRIMELPVPPLRERTGDATLLAHYFVDQFSRRFSKAVIPFSETTLAFFETYDWPGNIRELNNLVCQAFLLSDGPTITIAESRLAASDATGIFNYRQAKRRAIRAFEHQFLSRALARAQGNISEAARLIGTERRHLGRLLKKHGIDRLQPSV
jgi:DNA-binding NtrC family response regulator